MATSRRFFPSIGALRALEAFERLGSVTAAAAELSLTQGAVSRQLLALEEQIGEPVFRREKKRLFLTQAGSEYTREIREALGQISSATVKLKANPSGGGLSLAILPAFGMRWIAPRLSDFANRHPEVTVNLGTRLVPFDFQHEPFDAAIHYGRADWPEAEHMMLMSEIVVAVGSPSFLRDAKIASTQDVFDHPLMHLQTRPDAWRQWAASRGIEVGPTSGVVFDQFATMIQAVVHGLGLGLLPQFLVESELASGQLQLAVAGKTKGLGAYYLVWPPHKSDYAPLHAFRTWLQGSLQESARE